MDMLFPTHLAVAYVTARRLGLSVPWTVLGAVLPDLVDKPLGRLGETDRYHSVAHSVVGVGLTLGASDRARAVRSVWAGWATHLGADAAGMAANGRYRDLAFLLWPVARERRYSEMPADLVLPGTRSYFRSPAFVLELTVWLAAARTAAGRSPTFSERGD